MHAGPGRANLCIGVQLLDNLLGPSLYLSGLRVQAAVQVHAAEVVLWREDEPDTVIAVLSVSAYGLVVSGPGRRVRASSFLASERAVGHLGWLAVALLRAPAQPLSKVSHVLSVCYHVGILEQAGSTKSAPRFAVFLERNLGELVLNI